MDKVAGNFTTRMKQALRMLPLAHKHVFNKKIDQAVDVGTDFSSSKTLMNRPISQSIRPAPAKPNQGKAGAKSSTQTNSKNSSKPSGSAQGKSQKPNQSHWPGDRGTKRGGAGGRGRGYGGRGRGRGCSANQNKNFSANSKG